MRDSTPPLFLVTGSMLRAEQMDRPLAYYLRDQILKLKDDAETPVYVVSDYRWFFEADFAECPTIAVGGPGVNALTQKWLLEVPFVLEVDDEVYVQMAAANGHPARAAIWGKDHERTQVALATFIENQLNEFLAASAVPC